MRRVKLVARLAWIVATSDFAKVWWLLGGVAVIMLAGSIERYRLGVAVVYAAGTVWMLARLPNALTRMHESRRDVEIALQSAVAAVWLGLMAADRFFPDHGLDRIGTTVICSWALIRYWRSDGDAKPVADPLGHKSARG